MGMEEPTGTLVSAHGRLVDCRIHLNFSSGALRLPLNGVTQQITETDFYYSGIYVEDSGPTTQP